MIAVARQESGARKLEGHDIMALERFDPEVKHMIVFDVLSGEASIGCFLRGFFLFAFHISL